MNRDVLSVEEHFEWLCCSLATLRQVVVQNGSPDPLPQFHEPPAFYGYIVGRVDEAQRHARAIRQVLPADILNGEAPCVPAD